MCVGRAGGALSCDWLGSASAPPGARGAGVAGYVARCVSSVVHTVVASCALWGVAVFTAHIGMFMTGL